MDTQKIKSISAELNSYAATLRNVADHIATLEPDQLIRFHEFWLDLFQIGQNIASLAERLDAPYQAQFAGPTAADVHACTCDCGCQNQTIGDICPDCRAGDHLNVRDTWR